ncbi:hypothetical protein HYQ46_009309 [Verticillium longisporum]|nr:hypothetical protein HYQ46_009309 [Verticillium longisporum]
MNAVVEASVSSNGCGTTGSSSLSIGDTVQRARSSFHASWAMDPWCAWRGWELLLSFAVLVDVSTLSFRSLSSLRCKRPLSILWYTSGYLFRTLSLKSVGWRPDRLKRGSR